MKNKNTLSATLSVVTGDATQPSYQPLIDNAFEGIAENVTDEEFALRIQAIKDEKKRPGLRAV